MGYLRNEVVKKSVLQMADKFDELVDHYMKLYEHEKPTPYAEVLNSIPRNSKVTW